MQDDYREIPVPPGYLAEVVTHLEMRAPPRDPLPEGPWRLDRRRDPDIDWYRGLYRTVGAEWLWFSRLAMPRDKLAATLADPKVEVYALRRDGEDVGIGELNFGVAGEVEISFFGVVESEIGAGAGRWLMAALLARAWATAPERVWLHTCTFDHPNALPFYQRQGFTAYKRTVGFYPDPRLLGVLPDVAAARAPVIPADGQDANKT